MRYLKWLAMSLLVLSTLGFVGCAGEPAVEEAPATEAAPPPPPPPPATMASAHLMGSEGSEISGHVTFTEADGKVMIAAEVSGAGGAGTHGFHIHETGDCSAADFTSAGGHFNPAGVDHAGPDAESHHAGDLGNIEIGEDGSGSLELSSSMITLGEGANSVVGKAVILHEGTDDLTTQPTGAAGARLACGVIELSGDESGEMMDEPESEGGDEAATE